MPTQATTHQILLKQDHEYERIYHTLCLTIDTTPLTDSQVNEVWDYSASRIKTDVWQYVLDDPTKLPSICYMAEKAGCSNVAEFISRVKRHIMMREYADDLRRILSDMRYNYNLLQRVNNEKYEDTNQSK